MSGERPFQSVMNTASGDMKNPEYRKYMEQKQALEGSYPEIIVAPLARSAVQGAKALGPAIKDVFQTVEHKNWPTVYNHVVGGENIQPATEATARVMLRGRNPTSKEDITHAYRNLHPDEIANAKETGYFLPNPTMKYSDEGKWFSAGDAEGIFGRTWKNYPQNTTIRLPLSAVPKAKAAKYSDAEVLDKLTGKYGPLGN